MRDHLNNIIILIIILLLLCLNSSALDKNSEYYGETHKMLFNDPENCTSCHLYDKDIAEGSASTLSSSSSTSGEAAKAKTPQTIADDEYDFGEEDEEATEGAGWFFGKKEEAEEKKVDLSLYVSKSYKLSGFENKSSIIPHEFIKSHTNMCISAECHTDEELGLSHAVDLSPYDTYPDMIVPEEIPLNWDTEEYQEVMTCGSCHNPHLDWLSVTKSFDSQQPYKIILEVPYYKTDYLRIQDPIEGYATLCKSCHGEGY
jgi:hypothetical protein